MQAASTASLKYAEPSPLGLFGLAIGCAALLPVAFGVKAAFTPDALRTAALFCFLFGGLCQLLSGLMSFANKNLLGGTLMTTFAFSWCVHAWSLREASEGRSTSSTVVLSVDCCFLLIFLAVTFAFAFASRLLVLFLLDIDAIYIFRIARDLTHVEVLSTGIAIGTVVIMAIALYLAFAIVLANASGRSMLPIGGPLLKPVSPVPAPSPAEH